MPEVTPIIECDQVSFHYNGEEVLHNVSFSVLRGEYIGIVGPNGSGKTTLLKIILGLLKPSFGKVSLFGEHISSFREWRRIGYVPQHVFRGDVNFPATVREIVESGHPETHRGTFSLFEMQTCDEVMEALDRAEIGDLAKRRIGELSGGQRQRVFIARALVSRPDLLILDEPTVGIDAATEEKFYLFLEKLNRSGITIILVSHDLEAVAREVKKVLCLNRHVVSFGDKESMTPEKLNEMYAGKRILRHEHHDTNHTHL